MSQLVQSSNQSSEYVIREAERSDAQSLIDLHVHLAETEALSVLGQEEINRDAESVAKEIAASHTSLSDLYLVAATKGDQVVGYLRFRSDWRRKLAHQGQFGVGVTTTHRGQGLGAALIYTLLDWAEESDSIEKVCLGVLDLNERAQTLYARLGFHEEARITHQFKLSPNSYAADVRMAIFVKDPVPPEFQKWAVVRERLGYSSALHT